MGSYIYKVTRKIIELADGRKANVAKYAYKPYLRWSAEQENHKLHFQTGCYKAEKYVETDPEFTGLVVMETDHTMPMEINRGTFFDDWFADRWHGMPENKELQAKRDEACKAITGKDTSDFSLDIHNTDYTPSVEASRFPADQIKVFGDWFKDYTGRDIYIYGETA